MAGGGDEKLTVSFVDGDSELSNVDIDKNSYVTEPAAPTKEGYIFAGWYSDSACTKEFDFKNTKITENTKIYAKFVANDEKFTVSFNTNGGSSIASQTINAGEKVTKPADPTKANNKFAGWYCDSALTQPYDFSSQVLSSFTLYAKWTAESGTYTVTFNSNGGSAVPAQTVKAGEKAVKPANPTKSGYSFSGWYSDASLTTQYDFNSAVNADITLCAKWTSNGGGGGGGPVTPTTYWEVTFDANDGKFKDASKTDCIRVESGKTIASLPEVTRAGYAFFGWNTSANGDGDAFTSETPVTKSLTVYAQWSETPIVTFPTGSDSNTAALQVVNDTLASSLVNDAEKSGSNSIIVDASNENIIKVEIAYGTLNSLSSAIKDSSSVDSLTLVTSNSKITLDSDAIDGVLATNPTEVIISIEKTTGAPNLNNEIVYDLSISDSSGSPINPTKYGHITVTISAEGIANPDNVSVYYVDNAGTIISKCETVYNSKENTLTFTTSHNSYYAILNKNQVTFENSASASLVSKNGTYTATFTLDGNKPENYNSYIVDFLLTIETADENGFTLDFDGKTYFAGDIETSVGAKAEKYSVTPVNGKYADIYFSDIYDKHYTGDKKTYDSFFTVLNVWAKGAEGKAVATVSNIEGLDETATVTLTMIMYKNADAKKAGNYLVLSETLEDTAPISNFSNSASASLVSKNGTYTATFTLDGNKPENYNSYIVDFLLTIETADENGFTLDFDGKTYFAGDIETSVGAKAEKYSVTPVNGKYADIYFSDIYDKHYTGDKKTYDSFFTVLNVWAKGAEGKAVATVSNITDLSEDAELTITMVMYEKSDSKLDYFVLSNTLPGKIVKAQTSESQNTE